MNEDLPDIERIAIAVEATLESVRCAPEPMTGEQALLALLERLSDDGIDLYIEHSTNGRDR